MLGIIVRLEKHASRVELEHDDCAVMLMVELR